MQKRSSATWILLCVILISLVHLPTWAEDSSSQQEDVDIWQEITFEPDKDLQLTDKQIEKILQEINKLDPDKAEKLQKLRESDPKAFIESIREEIRKQVESKPITEPEPGWKEELDQQQEEFLKWFKKNYRGDYRELMNLQKCCKERFVQKLLDLMQIYGPIQWTEQRNPKLAEAMKKNLELQKQRDTLLLQIRISPEEEHAQLIKELEVVVSERFDTIVLEKQLQFEWLGHRLKELTKRLENRAAELDTLKKSKVQSVEKRMKELVERTENVNWN